MTGFWVKAYSNFTGPFDKLSEARAEARGIGTGILIYHGTLIQLENGEFDTSQMSLVPKTRKE